MVTGQKIRPQITPQSAAGSPSSVIVSHIASKRPSAFSCLSLNSSGGPKYTSQASSSSSQRLRNVLTAA
eukprot:CAMPEP_0115555306 /NCGR_PEP_ID=MMETSP0271-20121206/97756_1 /TAXON_ID=71861 /ORGANISM="Scrippsiella trochoidea, Strain CCMP3099" /LENGTH=68 /DNA_ID=CAMNT_0002989089 /DNA_START=167 /DNA_END=369 /DNA_ORIENTATION=+